MKNFNTIWKKFHDNKALESYHFVQRALLIAVRSKRNDSKIDIVYGLLQKYFSPIVDVNKLINGKGQWSAVIEAANMARYSKTILGVAPEDIFESADEEKMYDELLKELRSSKLDKLGRKYVYYFTSKEDLTPEQMAVQSAHVTLVTGHALGKTNIDPHGIYFQWIGVETEKDLKKVAQSHSHERRYFHEPDIGNKLTSIAFHPVLWNKRQEFLEYPLMKF